MDPVTAIATAPTVLTTDVSVAFYVAVTLYGVSALLYVSAFVESPRWVGMLAKWGLALAFVCHGADISLRAFDSVHPGTSVREALGFGSWVMVGAFLVAGLRDRLAVLGSFVAPVALAVLTLARLSPTGEGPDELTSLGRIHIALATIGVAIFALATAIAVLYLLENRNLKRKRFDRVLFKKGLSLESLDVMARRLVLVGFPIFTAALMLGVVWVSQRASGFNRPEYPLALVTWISFAVLIVGRTTHGWRGRRAAWITIIGFCFSLLVFAVYFARRMWA